MNSGDLTSWFIRQRKQNKVSMVGLKACAAISFDIKQGYSNARHRPDPYEADKNKPNNAALCLSGELGEKKRYYWDWAVSVRAEVEGGCSNT